MNELSNKENQSIIISETEQNLSTEKSRWLGSNRQLPPTIKSLDTKKKSSIESINVVSGNNRSLVSNKRNLVLKVKLGGNGYLGIKDFGQDYVGKDGKGLFDMHIKTDRIDLLIKNVPLQMVGNLNHLAEHMTKGIFFNTSFMSLENGTTIITPTKRTPTYTQLKEALNTGRIINNSLHSSYKNEKLK